MGSCDLVLRSDYENINIAPIKCELSVCDLQESRMRGMMSNMVLVQYLFFASCSERGERMQNTPIEMIRE